MGRRTSIPQKACRLFSGRILCFQGLIPLLKQCMCCPKERAFPHKHYTTQGRYALRPALCVFFSHYRHNVPFMGPTGAYNEIIENSVCTFPSLSHKRKKGPRRASLSGALLFYRLISWCFSWASASVQLRGLCTSPWWCRSPPAAAPASA